MKKYVEAIKQIFLLERDKAEGIWLMAEEWEQGHFNSKYLKARSDLKQSDKLTVSSDFRFFH